MNVIMCIKNYQLHKIDIENKNTILIEHKYIDKEFVLVNGLYAVDIDHTIYRVNEIKSPIFDVKIFVKSADVANIKLLFNNIFYCDTSNILRVIIFNTTIILNNLTYSKIGHLSDFYIKIIMRRYIFVSYIVENNFFIEINDTQFLHKKKTFYKKDVQDFNFSNEYAYITRHNLVYRRQITVLLHVAFDTEENNEKNIINLPEFDKIDNYFSNSSAIVLYNDVICDTNYVTDNNYPIICIQSEKIVINCERNTGDLYIFNLNRNEKYVTSRLLLTNTKKYYNDSKNIVIYDSGKLTVYTINAEGLNHTFSVEGLFFYEKNNVKRCAQVIH